MRIILCSLFLLVACSHQVTVKRISSLKQYPAKPYPCSIQILSSRPDGYEEIASLQGVGGSALGDYVDLVQQVACANGGDAVTIITSTNATHVVGGRYGTTSYNRNESWFSVLRKVRGPASKD